MATVYEVQSQDITELSDLNLTKLLKILLHLEAKSSGIAEMAIDVALNILVADGGEDGRIEWTDGPDSTNYLPSRLVQFQNKATKMGPTACANEIIGSDDNLKSMVEQALNDEGSYILFTTQELNKQQKKERVDAIREKLSNLNKPYAKTAIIKVYDASTIQGWVNHYAPAITAVLNWVGKPLVNGLYTWEEWEKFEENHLFEYVFDDTRKEALKNLRQLLIQPRKCARIIGLSGLGKTRLALEVCRGQDESDGFCKRVIYMDAAYGEPNLPGLVYSWIKLGLDGLLVVDNCDLGLHKQVRRVIEHPDSVMSLLSLHYNPEKDSDTDQTQLTVMSDKLIKSMLEPVYGDKISDLDRIVGFAQGFPQMAVLLAKARLDQTQDMGSLTDDDLINKMLWGGAEQDENAKIILQACSLFDKFGLENEMEVESKFIAENIAGTDEDSLFRCIKTFEERGVINKGGRFAQIIPKPLAIRLAADWWRFTRPKRQQELVESEMPGQLEQSFCEQISKLDFLPEVKELTETLCGDQGPFGQAEVILSDRGSRLFRSLVEVNPKATSEALFRILSSLPEEQFKDISGDTRRHLVWALEKLCFHENEFENSVKCLMWLAAAENEDWANNATGQFLQLFRTFLSGTEASPKQRLAVIDGALQTDSITIRELAVKALKTVINTHSGSRTIGAEYQGSGKPLEEWRPKIWQEAFDYWIAALERLTSIALENSGVSQLAKDGIAYHLRGLVQRSQDVTIALDNTIKQIVSAHGALWPEALESIKNVISYDSEKMPDEAKVLLNQWIELLTPECLEDRIKLIVSIPSYDHEQDENGDFIDIAAINAKDLAQEFTKEISDLLPYLEQLLTGEQRQGFGFGLNVILASRQVEPLLTETINTVSKLESANINFLLGVLSGVYQLDEKLWHNYVIQFYDNRKLNEYYPDIIQTGHINEEYLDNVISLIRSGYLSETRAIALNYGRTLDYLEPQIIAQFIIQLRGISSKSAWISLNILSVYCHGNNDKWRECESYFKEITVDLSLEKESRQQNINMHYWKKAVEKILNGGDSEFAKKLTVQIFKSGAEKIDYNDLHHYVKPVLILIFSKYGEDVWPFVAEAIKDSDPVQEFILTQLLGSENGFRESKPSVLSALSDEVIEKWCLQEPQKAPEFIAMATEVFFKSDEEYRLSTRTHYLLDEFGNNKKMLNRLSANMGSFGWQGSVVPIYRKQVAALKPLLNHKFQTVRNWTNNRISYLNKSIEKESIRDEESEWGIS